MILTKKVKYRGGLIDVNSLSCGSKMRVEVQCPVCLSIRHSFYSLIRLNQTCHKCANKIKNTKLFDIGLKINKLTVISNNSDGTSNFICDCGKICSIDRSLVRTGHTKSCGCIQKYAAKINGSKTIKSWVGENHPNWRGGISSERDSFNSSKKAREWRLEVFKRDGYTCMICGQLGGNLNAHHIKQFSTHKHLRHDVDNGITLCYKCHKDIHKIIHNKKL